MASSLLRVRLPVASPSISQPVGFGTQLIRLAARREQVYASAPLREPTPTNGFAAFASNKPWVHAMLRCIASGWMAWPRPRRRVWPPTVRYAGPRAVTCSFAVGIAS